MPVGQHIRPTSINPRLGKGNGALMARQTFVRLTDDLDGGQAARTIEFAWDGVSYEIDLNAAHADAFAHALAPYVAAARRTSPQRRATRAAARRGSSPARRDRSAADPAAIRDWASRNGYQVSGRGRIPAAVVDAYRSAQGDAPAATPPVASTPSTSTDATTNTSPAKKAPAKKTAAKKTAAKKTAAKKAPAAKSTRKKAAPTKTASRTGSARKRGARKATSRS